MQIIKYDPKTEIELIAEAVKVLRAGGIIIYPTETCYGVAVDSTNAEAVKKLLEYKRRPEGKAISVAVANKEMAAKYVEINATADDVYAKFLPGPVTVISKLKENSELAPGLAAENGTMGIRIPDFELALKIIKSLDKPMTATSANSSGKKTPYTIDDIFENITEKQKALIDLVIDFGELPHNPPSTVIDTTKLNMQVLRQGQINFGSTAYDVELNSAEEMQLEGSKLVAKYKHLLKDNCLLLMFNADLGAGKTQFTKGMAKELGITDVVSSPTFTLILEYDFDYNQVKGKLIHFDAWRLEQLEELDQLGLPAYLVPGNIVVVEWAGATESYFAKLADQKNVIRINAQIEYLSETKRKLTILE